MARSMRRRIDKGTVVILIVCGVLAVGLLTYAYFVWRYFPS